MLVVSLALHAARHRMPPRARLVVLSCALNATLYTVAWYLEALAGAGAGTVGTYAGALVALNAFGLPRVEPFRELLGAGAPTADGRGRFREARDRGLALLAVLAALMLRCASLAESSVPEIPAAALRTLPPRAGVEELLGLGGGGKAGLLGGLGLFVLGQGREPLAKFTFPKGHISKGYAGTYSKKFMANIAGQMGDEGVKDLWFLYLHSHVGARRSAAGGLPQPERKRMMTIVVPYTFDGRAAEEVCGRVREVTPALMEAMWNGRPEKSQFVTMYLRVTDTCRLPLFFGPAVIPVGREYLFLLCVVAALCALDALLYAANAGGVRTGAEARFSALLMAFFDEVGRQAVGAVEALLGTGGGAPGGGAKGGGAGGGGGAGYDYEKDGFSEKFRQMEEERRGAAGVLGLPMHASKAEFRRAYKRAAMSWHPDKNVGNEAHAGEKFKELQDASVVLGLKL